MADVGTSAENQRGKSGFARLRVRAAQGGADFLIVAQRGKGGFGDFVAVLAAELFVFAEIGGEDGIGRLFESQHFSQNFGGMVELCGVHNVMGSLKVGKWFQTAFMMRSISCQKPSGRNSKTAIKPWSIRRISVAFNVSVSATRAGAR